MCKMEAKGVPPGDPCHFLRDADLLQIALILRIYHTAKQMYTSCTIPIQVALRSWQSFNNTIEVVGERAAQIGRIKLRIK